MSIAYYVAILVFCFGILGLILAKTFTGSINRQKKTYIFLLIFASCFFITSDLIWMCINGNVNVPKGINYMLNLFYFIGTLFVSYTFFLYSENVQQSRLFRSKLIFVLTGIPAIILLLLLFTTMQTKWIFYINENNEYVRGKIYIVQILLSFGYPLISSIKALIKSFKKANYFKRIDYISIFKFLICPSLGLLLQYFIPHVPFCSIGISLGILWLYLENEDMIMYVDPLTDIYNKKAFAKRLHHDMLQLDEESRYYLFMLDIDSFKTINDSFGHVEGDLALMVVAKVLKKYCDINNAFVARYGGDEFSILLNCQPHQFIESFCRGLDEVLESINVDYRRPYEISVSYGYAAYAPSIMNIPDFIDKADEHLYINKQAKKNKQ
ncbi:MAG: GGDEF domain-containing protein [Erysipelotrichaceae bacterium]|nr:GGDEF domain-containing protein [Erysipelotrichaceae bacterium]